MTYFINKKILNNSFTEAYNSEFFVDKSEIIEKLNKQINKIGKYLCITRPKKILENDKCNDVRMLLF